MSAKHALLEFVLPPIEKDVLLKIPPSGKAAICVNDKCRQGRLSAASVLIRNFVQRPPQRGLSKSSHVDA
jgi:hypothetical protein